jgi:molybdopterin synthase catalytic subunit
MIMIEQWLAEIKNRSNFEDLGMILIHNGVVRATSKEGKKVAGMHLSYNKDKLMSLLNEYEKREGIVHIKAWINEGTLKVGDDIMYVMIAGRLRKFVIPTLEEFVSRIKNEVVAEEEFS